MISFKRLREIVTYDPATGKMVRRISRGPRKAGTEIGWLSHGYLRTHLDGVDYAVHRLIVFYMTGEWPTAEVDHINGNRSDNRWANLRSVSNFVNAQNRTRARPRNKAKLLGAFPHSDGRHWRAQIMAFGVRQSLGLYDTAEQAHEAYLAAKRSYHPGWTPPAHL